MYRVMPKQPDQRQLVVAVVFEPEHDALIICRVAELALLVLKGLELPCVFQRRVEGIAVAGYDEARTLVQAIRPLTYRTHEVRIIVLVIVALKSGLLEWFLQIAAAADMEGSLISGFYYRYVNLNSL
jgi:hypothetical protein